jgi:hypothetical protein
MLKFKKLSYLLLVVVLLFGIGLHSKLLFRCVLLKYLQGFVLYIILTYFYLYTVQLKSHSRPV